MAHIARHAVTPEEVEQVIEDAPLDVERQIRNGEVRFVQLGATQAGRVLFVVVTLRGDDLRVVTAFPADRASRRFYEEQKRNANDQSNRNP